MKASVRDGSREGFQVEEERHLVQLGPDVFLAGHPADTDEERKEAEQRIHDLEQQVKELQEALELERKNSEFYLEMWQKWG